jgi:hydrogenase expression/formation protein HypC
MCLGIPGQIVEITDAVNLFGIVSVSGVRREINLACVVNDQHPIESCKGDWVLVHVGFAMSRIDEAEAARTLRLLAELGEMQQQLEAMQPDASQPFGTQALRHA